MQYPFRNLVFEGGGVRGVAYIGALRYLNEIQLLSQTHRFAGTSAGAITALLLGLRIPMNEIEEIHEKMPFKDFKDDDFLYIRDSIRILFDGFGVYKGDIFTKWIEDIIEQYTDKRDTTFQELYDLKGTDVYFQGTNVSTHQLRTFSRETSPDIPLTTAIRISMSIPFFFKSIELDGHYYVDGGVLDNYPISLFDNKVFISNENNFTVSELDKAINNVIGKVNAPSDSHSLKLLKKPNSEIGYNKETLGFRLESEVNMAVLNERSHPIEHPIGHNALVFLWNFSQTVLKGKLTESLSTRDSMRTVYIDTDFQSSFDFNITKEQRKKLIASGEECTKKYFSNYNNPEIEMYNRPM